MSGNAPSANPLSYGGILPNFPPNQIQNNRPPLTTDINANTGDEWRDYSITPPDFWKLGSLNSNIATWILLAAGTGNIRSLSGSANTPVFPSGNLASPRNNIQFIGGSAAVTIVEHPTTHQLEIDVNPDLLAYYSLTPYIVGQVGDIHAQFTGATAIQDAITAATATGGNVYIKPGIYTENITLVSGVNLVGFGTAPIILGKCSFSAGGSVNLYDITLQTNGDYVIEVTGSASCAVNLVSCFIEMTNNIALHNTNSNAATIISVEETDSEGAFPLWNQTGPGTIFCRQYYAGLDQRTAIPATSSAGLIQLWWSGTNFPIVTSGTAGINIFWATVIPAVLTVDLGLTFGGSGAHTFEESQVGGQVIINSPTVASISQSTVNSSQTNAIDGTGTLTFNSIDFLGTSSQIASTLTLSRFRSTDYSPAKWVVSSVPGKGDFTTISAAVAAASAGDNIFIREGTYTENVAVTVANLSFSALPGSANVGTVNVLGEWTFSLAGSMSISNINLQTNGSFILSVSGANASLVYLNNCFLNCTNSTGISYTCSNTASFIEINDGGADLTTTGISFWNHSGAGFIEVTFFAAFNTGASATASNNSAGSVSLQDSLFESPFSTSGTGGIGIINTVINSLSTNTTALTANGTGTTAAEGSQFIGGSSPAISIGAGATLSPAISLNINSSNTNAIAGAGALHTRYLTYTGASSTIQGTVTVTVLPGLP